MTPTHRVEHVVENCPDCGTHRTGGCVQRTWEVIELPVVPVQGHRACLHRQDLPSVSTPPSAHRATGRRGTGAPTLRCQRAQPDRHVAGSRAPAHPQHPVVSAHRASVAPQRGGHCERHSPDRAAGPTGGGRDPGPHPRQPSGPRRRNRLAPEWEQRLRLDFQHPHRTLLPANATSCGGVGARRWWTRR